MSALAMPITITSELALNRACLRDVIAQVDELNAELQFAIDKYGRDSTQAAVAFDELEGALLRREDMRAKVKRLESERDFA